MERLQSVLPRVLRQRGLFEHAQACGVCATVNQWIETNLRSCAHYLQATSFENGQVVITAENSVAADECQQRVGDLMDFLIGEHSDAVRGIRVTR